MRAYLKARGDKTDFEALRRMSDDDIQRGIDQDPDAIPLDWPGFDDPPLPPTKRQLTLRLDAEVIDHFRAQGPRWQTRINAVLKRYVAAQKAK